MDWNAPTWWWLATGALIAAELVTGTFYLLMLAAGAAAGALAAHAGLSATLQWVVAALMGAGATSACYFKRAHAPSSEPPATNRDVNIDIGQPVRVDSWASDGSARVHYRGASWLVRFAGMGQPLVGEHVIVSVHGNYLGVAPAMPR